MSMTETSNVVALTLSVIAVLCSFLILNIPGLVFIVVSVINRNAVYSSNTWIIIFFWIKRIVVLQAGINFFLYIAVNKVYRSEFKKIFLRKCLQPK